MLVSAAHECRRCPDCGAPLSNEPWAGRLCLSCLAELALSDTSLAVEDDGNAEELPTQLYSPDSLAPGQILGGRYRLRAQLGRGGMGEVWRALDLKLRVEVALKALRPALLASRRAVETLRQEVRTAREVVSPNVCRVFDLVEVDGRELVSMEYIDGTTLLATLGAQAPLALDEAQEIASQLLAGLEAIHGAGLVHGDIKPENVMLTRTGRVVVMDFGIAKALAEAIAGTVAGTPAYMAPEQARGEALDARADLYAAGIVLAEMVAPGGAGGGGRERVWEGVRAVPPRLDDTPWAPVLVRAVASAREERFPSAAALARALEEVTLRVVGSERLDPYPGLASFDKEDAAYFFGRELEVEAMWRKLRRPHLLALVGPSGAGKSSFLRAGLLATLPPGWRAVVATPGDRPFAALAQALVPEMAGDTEGLQALVRVDPDAVSGVYGRWRRGHVQALLVVDQFEELFTQNPPEIQERFAQTLARLALEADVHVLLSLRDDFLFHCHAHEALRPILSELTLLGPPTGAALRRALVQPALKCGYRFEDEALVDEMLAEVEGERGALPLLAFAAAQLWERRDRERGLLTREPFTAIGGVGGALAQHAEATLERLGQDRLPVVRELFRNLVTAQATRATLDREELLSVFPQDTAAEAATVLDALVDARLLTSYEIPPTEGEAAGHHRIEVIHESLLASWPRLVRWRTQDQDGALLRDQLRQVARLWEERGEPEDLLWTGTSFREYQLWRERYGGSLSGGEETFVRAMTERATRRRRRRRLAIGALVAAALAVATGSTVLWRQSDAARARAEREALRAEASKLLALGQVELEAYPTAALAYATRSLELADTREGRLLALEALQQGPTAFVMPMEIEETRESYIEGGLVASTLAFSPDGAWLAIGGGGYVQVRPRDGSRPLTLETAVFNPSPIQVAFGSRDRLVTDHYGDLQMWSLPGGRQFWRTGAETGPSVLFGREGRFFTETQTEEGLVLRRWSLTEPTSVHLATYRTDWWSDLDAGGGQVAYTAGRQVLVRSLADPAAAPRVVGQHLADVRYVSFHPGDERLAASDAAGEVRIWSLSPGSDAQHPLRTLRSGALVSLTHAPSGRWLAAWGELAGRLVVGLYDLEGPPEAEPVLLQKAAGEESTALWDARFDPTGGWLATSHYSQVSFWPLDHEYARVLQPMEAAVHALTFTHDGAALAVACDDGTLQLRRLAEDGPPSRTLMQHDHALFSILADLTGDALLATGETGESGQAFVVPLDGGRIRPFTAFGEGSPSFGSLALSPSGRRFAVAPFVSGAMNKTVRAWDLESGATWRLSPVPGARRGYSDAFQGLAFLDEDRLLSTHFEGLRLWSLKDGLLQTISTLPHGRLALARSRRFLVSTRPEMPYSSWRKPMKARLVVASLEGEEERILSGHGDFVTAVALDPTDRFVATGSGDGWVRVGTVAGGEPHLVAAHEGPVHSVVFSPDGRWVASGGADRRVRLSPVPELSRTPLQLLPIAELVARLRTLTNLRAVEDPESLTGWTLDIDAFPGWEKVPTW